MMNGQQNDGVQMQHILNILLRQPDPNQMLKHSKPFDRVQDNINAIEIERFQKCKWPGALPSKIRDSNLNLNFDLHMEILKRSSFSNNSSQSRRGKTNPQEKNEMSVEYPQQKTNTYGSQIDRSQCRSVESSRIFKNIHRFVNPKNMSQQQSPTQRQNQKLFNPAVHNSYVMTSPFNQTFSTPFKPSAFPYNMSRINQSVENHPQTQKTFSIKYIGVHKDIIGVLSRKVALESAQESNAKRKRTLQKRDVGESNKMKSDNKVKDVRQINQMIDGTLNETKKLNSTNEDDLTRLSNLIPTNNYMKIFDESHLGWEGNDNNEMLYSMKNIFNDSPKQESKDKLPAKTRSISCGESVIKLKKQANFRNWNGKIKPNEQKLETDNSNQVKKGREEEFQNNSILQEQFEVPNPIMYDKYIVNKYSPQKKLNVLQKKKEVNPNKQQFLYFNNQ